MRAQGPAAQSIAARSNAEVVSGICVERNYWPSADGGKEFVIVAAA
jgi:hypothetical protein